LKVAADLGRLELLYGTDMDKPLRVGIIELGAERGWATIKAHERALESSNFVSQIGLVSLCIQESL
jgi:hypothetical protein